MSKALFKDEQELKAAIKNYMTNNDFHSPRHLRTSIGVSKHILSTWKKTKPEFFNLIKQAQDVILAELELLLIKNAYTKSKEHKFNPVGIIFTMRAYDKETYIPEARQEEIEQKDPIVIETTNTSTNKVLLPQANKED